MEESQQEKLLASWQKAFRKGIDYDLWGQPIEAIEGYKRLSKHLVDYTSDASDLFTDEQRKILGKIATCLDLRSRSLKAKEQHPGHQYGIALVDVKKLDFTFQQLLEMRPKDFPIDVSAAELWTHTMNSIALVQGAEERNEDESSVEEQTLSIKARGNLLPKPLPIGGKQVLTIHIEKLGLKDASQFIDPYITVSVKDEKGVDLTVQQDSPVCKMKEDQCVLFNVHVHIQKPIDILPPGYAIFFEFKHYKPRKKTLSTKCWSFMEKDEIKDGPAVLELYKKPADFRRKSLHLFTIKPLYLHLKMFINT